MKKVQLLLSVFSVGLLSVSALAADSISTEKKETRPVAVLRIADNSTQPAKLSEGRQVSISQKQDLCVIIANMPYQQENQIVYQFISPKPTKFEAPGMNVKTSADKKHFEITRTLTNMDTSANTFHQCWRFDNSDPVGTYNLDVKMNDINFTGLSFNVIK